MLDINQISVHFAGKFLFNEIQFQVNKGDRIGLVGKNGAGKSTLLKLIAGTEMADSGTISFGKGVKVGLLRQDLEFVGGYTVWEEAKKAFEELNVLEREASQLGDELGMRTDYESEEYASVIDRLHKINERIELLGGYRIDGEIEKVLKGLGFQSKDLERQTEDFSGGWRMRIELGKLLLQKPDVLLLDEPTNHLDIESIIWLEKYLKGYPGAVLLVSHDKRFLDLVCNRTIEIQNGRIYDVKGNYSKYLIQRAEMMEQQLAAMKNQEKEIKKTEELIEKFRYKSSKAAFAQTLIKKLDKMDRIEVDETNEKTMRFSFPEAPHSGKVVLKIEDLAKSYGEKQVFSGVNFELERGEKVAFVGQNGQGKTTLARCIVDEVNDYIGTLELGYKVRIGYFAQNQAERLDDSKTLLDIMLDSANNEMRPKVRSLLGSFLFSGEDVDKKVKVLSGGERGRLALCKLLLEPYNLLILDEPTNHLDIQSKEILKQALKTFDGSIVLVSHDRDFLEGLTDKVLEFKDGIVKTFLGDLKDYMEQRSLEDLIELEKKTVEKKDKPKSNKLSREQSRELDKEIRKVQNQVGKFEREIEQIEKSIAEDDLFLADASKLEGLEDKEQFFKAYQEKNDSLETVMLNWESVVEELDKLKARRG
jgi:ATP-binding cassette subfamily F protein 3